MSRNLGSNERQQGGERVAAVGISDVEMMGLNHTMCGGALTGQEDNTGRSTGLSGPGMSTYS